MGGTVIKTRAQILVEKGEMIGEEKKAKETARNLYEDGMAVEKIAKYVKYPAEVIKKWLGLVTV